MDLYEQIWSYLEKEGHDTETIAKVVDLTWNSRQHANDAPHRKDALFPKDNAWAAVLEEALGEPLRQWQALMKECREDIGKVVLIFQAGQLAELEAHATRLQHGVDDLGDSIDGVERILAEAH